MDRICTEKEISIINRVCDYFCQEMAIFPFYFKLRIYNDTIKFTYQRPDVPADIQETFLQVLRNVFNKYFTEEYLIKDNALYIPYDDIYKLYVMLKLKGDIS